MILLHTEQTNKNPGFIAMSGLPNHIFQCTHYLDGTIELTILDNKASEVLRMGLSHEDKLKLIEFLSE